MRNRTRSTLVSSSCMLALTFAVEGTAQEVPLLPPEAKPGQCYTRVYVPPTYETKEEHLVAVDGTEHLEATAPEFRWIEKEVLIKEESEEIEVIPATFKTVEEEVMIKPESEEIVVVPAEFETVEENVLVREAYTTWKRGRGPVEKIDASTGEIMCLVEVPAEYKTIKRRKLKTPPTTQVVKKPAEYKTVKKRVVDTPVETRTIKVPAEYVTVKVQELVNPAQTLRSAVPEELVTVARTVKLSDGRVEWRQILCETNMTADVIKSIQAALQSQGYYKGSVDGALGPNTMGSVRAFQREKNLASGQLTIETLDALGVQL